MSDLSNLQRRLQAAFGESLSDRIIADLLAEVGKLELKAALVPELVEALKAIRNACKDEEFIKVQADFIGSIIFGSAAEKVDSAIQKAEALK
jgi:hypothetical protein